MAENTALTLVDPERHNAVVQRNQAVIAMKQDVFQVGVHYGEPFKDAGKPTLLKPGAEMLMSRFRLWPEYREKSIVEDWDKGLFHYRYECRLIDQETGVVVGAGIGSCNTREDKYRWRKAERVCPVCGEENIRKSKRGEGWYCWEKTGGCGANFDAGDTRIVDQEMGKVPNEDPFTLVNTVDKMAQKRALVAAVLVGTGASAYFTQDVEDFPGYARQSTQAEDVVAGEIINDQPTPRPPTRRKPAGNGKQSGTNGAGKYFTNEAWQTTQQWLVDNQLADNKHHAYTRLLRILDLEGHENPWPEINQKKLTSKQLVDLFMARAAEKAEAEPQALFESPEGTDDAPLAQPCVDCGDETLRVALDGAHRCQECADIRAQEREGLALAEKLSAGGE